MSETINVADLKFKPVPAAAEATYKYSKGIFGGTKKKFAECILAGKAETAEIRVIDWRLECNSEGGSYTDAPYCQITTPDGVLIKEWVWANIGAYFSGAAEWVEDDEQNSEETEAIRKKVRIGYILHYFIGKKEYYQLIDKKQFKDLNLFDDLDPLDRGYGFIRCF